MLIVDPDERITPELQREICEAIRRHDVDGFYVNRRFWFLDGWINHCGYFPSWNLRLFRHRLGQYEQIEIGDTVLSGDNEVHEHVLLNGRAGYLAAPMEHYAFPGIATFVEKHNRYSTWEAAYEEFHQPARLLRTRSRARQTRESFNENHVCPCRTVPHLARFSVFFAVQPLFGALR